MLGPGRLRAPLELADELDPWYVSEWLQAEVIAGLIEADAEDLARAGFRLAPGVADALVHERSPAYLGGLPYIMPAVGRVMPDLLDAFHTGAGVPFTAYGSEAMQAKPRSTGRRS